MNGSARQARVRQEYDALVARRRACQACNGLVNPSSIAAGAYDHGIRRAITSPGTPLPTGAHSIGVYHCGARVVRIARSLEQQRADWQRVAVALRRPAA